MNREEHKDAARQEESFTQEEIERYSEYLEKASRLYWSTTSYGNYEVFRQFCKNSDEFLCHNEILPGRELWVEMKSSKKRFQKFIEQEINKAIEANDQSLAYHYISVYKVLGYDTAADYLSKIISNPKVWKNTDGLIQASVLEHLSNLQNSETIPALLEYINIILSPSYGRPNNRDTDLLDCVYAIRKTAGKKARMLLSNLAEKDATFDGWFKKMQLENIVSHEMFGKKLIFEPFDETLERRRLEKLKAITPHPFPPIKHGVYKKDTEDEFDENGDGERKETENWESDTLVNFYGRFLPDRKECQEITAENYLKALFGTLSSEEKTRDYFRFFNGLMPEKWQETPFPEMLTLAQIHHLATLGCSRARVLDTLEGKQELALAELKILRTYISGQLSKNSDESERMFLISSINTIDETANLIQKKHKKHDTSLPQSANEFLMYHAKHKKVRQIPDFRTLLNERIRHYLALYFAHNDQTTFQKQRTGSIALNHGPEIFEIQTIIGEYFENLSLYRTIEIEDVPIYWEAMEKLQDLSADRNVVFGRDGRFFFTALKANDFGIKNNVLKYVIVTRNIQNKESRKRIAQYLQQNGVTLDFAFIDTGYVGSIPQLAINALMNTSSISMSQEEIDKKILLLASSHSTRRELSRKLRTGQDYAIGRIEDRPQPFQSPTHFEMDDHGRLRPILKPNRIDEQLRAWTVEHSIMRNFAPRSEPDRGVHYIKENPLEGCTFIACYHGNSISTHPLELWKDYEGKKFLLKAGPRHTVQADYIGYRFLQQMGITIPKVGLVEIDGELRLRMEFLENWEGGTIQLPEKYHQSLQIQEGFFVDMLLGQYDRTPWNFMFHPDGKRVAFIDNGGSLYSRARGGYKGFADHFGIEELADLLSNPQFPGRPVNEAYHDLLEVKNGRIIIKNLNNFKLVFNGFVDCFGDYAKMINDIIESTRLYDGRRSQENLARRVEQLEQELKDVPPDSSDYQKTASAIETFKKAIEEGGEATYLKKALIQRAQNIIVLFSELVAEKEKEEKQKD